MEPLDLVPRRLVVSVEDLAPLTVAQGSRPARRVNDVREQDSGQHTIHVLGRVERSDLLLRPRERVDVWAGRFAPGRFVRQQDDPRCERTRFAEPHIGDRRLRTEQALPATQDHRVDRDPVLVDQAVVHQRIDQVGAACDQDVPTGLILQLSDFDRDVAAEKDRVLPRELLEAVRDDVLRKGVDPVGEALVTRSRGPERRPDVIGHAPEERGVDGEELLDS